MAPLINYKFESNNEYTESKYELDSAILNTETDHPEHGRKDVFAPNDKPQYKIERLETIFSNGSSSLKQTIVAEANKKRRQLSKDMVIAEKRDIESFYSQNTLDKIPGLDDKDGRISLYAKRFEMGAAAAMALRENVNRSIHNQGDLDDYKSVNDIDLDEIADRIEEL